MLLNKTIVAALVAAAAGGIVIGSATTYVVVNNGCNCPSLQEEYRSPLLGGGRHIDLEKSRKESKSFSDMLPSRSKP